MILVDANLLLYADNEASPHHEPAKLWWFAALSGTEPICLPWAVLYAYIRIGTSASAFARPLRLADAVARVQEWLEHPAVRVINPTESHWQIFKELLRAAGAKGNLVTDAHLASLAIEHGCELYSTDADFARFPRLKWRNPLAS
jgi:uncharacterized protein